PGRLFTIFTTSSGFSVLLDYLTPFYRLIGAVNYLWQLYHESSIQLSSTLNALCHPFYQQYMFAADDETQIFQLNSICKERPFLAPADHLKLLLSAWDRQ